MTSISIETTDGERFCDQCAAEIPAVITLVLASARPIHLCAAHAATLAASLVLAVSGRGSAGEQEDELQKTPESSARDQAWMTAAVLYSIEGCTLVRESSRARLFSHHGVDTPFWLPKRCHAMTAVQRGSGRYTYTLTDVPAYLIYQKRLADVASLSAPVPAQDETIAQEAEALRQSNPTTLPPTEDELRQTPESAARDRLHAEQTPQGGAFDPVAWSYPATCPRGHAYVQRETPQGGADAPVVGWCATCDDVVRGVRQSAGAKTTAQPQKVSGTGMGDWPDVI